MMKIFLMQPVAEGSRGIKTTLNIKYNNNPLNDQNSRNHSSVQSVGGSINEVSKPEFMSCKNMLSSEIVEMRGEGNINKSRK